VWTLSPRGPDWMPITPKTGSLFHAETQSGSGQLIKFREDIAVLILCDSNSCIQHFDVQTTVTMAAADDDIAALSVAHSVGHQIEQNSFQEDQVAADPGATRHHPQAQSLFARGHRECRLDPFEEAIDWKFRDAGSEHAGVEL
jgi:hypothetical protein